MCIRDSGKAICLFEYDKRGSCKHGKQCTFSHNRVDKKVTEQKAKEKQSGAAAQSSTDGNAKDSKAAGKAADSAKATGKAGKQPNPKKDGKKTKGVVAALAALGAGHCQRRPKG